MDSHGGGFLGCVRRNPQIPFHRNGGDHSTAICLYATLVLLPFYIWESFVLETMPVTSDSITVVALLVFIAGFRAYQAYGKAQAVLVAAKGGLILYLNPLYVAVLAWIFLGEPLQFYHYLGAALILPGILYELKILRS
jgi:drug/metabolite transporter (DMT)-like permease